MKLKTTFLIIGWLILVYLLGIWFFTQGFLLKRFVIEKNSTCETDFIHQKDSDSYKDGCWMHSNFKKAVVIVIDALRYDFASYDDSYNNYDRRQVPPFKNKLTTINKLLTERPYNGRLFRFIADPPTTTLQRLKGLTTGSLPTFIDAGSNFAGTSISEDNWVDQLLKNNKKVTFMGDDTWLSLYPKQFNVAFPFPSFNVKDLHTVDNGVLEHLMPEIKKKNWDVLIAHFLGVDHCGHRYGPNHEAMAEKLAQMDEVLRNVTASLDKDTILFLFGDHGMTKTGDHGGDSKDELEAAMFIYSPSKITNTRYSKDKVLTISQVDLVPTLSLLLGIPIPFSNLGQVIPELFNNCLHWNGDANPTRQIYHTVKALHLNAHQVHNFIVSYEKMSSDLPSKEFQNLFNLFKRTEQMLQNTVTQAVQFGFDDVTRMQLNELEKDYIEYLSRAQHMCRSIWAKFDVVNIILGLCTVLIAVISTTTVYRQLSSDKESHIMWALVGSMISTMYLVFLYILHGSEMITFSLLVFGFSLGFIFVCFYKAIYKPKNQNKFSDISDKKNWYLNVSACIILGLQLMTFFSNSYVVYEDDAVSFLLKGFVTFLFYVCCTKIASKLESKNLPQSRSKTKFDIGRFLTSPNILLYFQLFCLLGFLRMTPYFEPCREEQWTCEINSMTQSLSALTGEMVTMKGYRYLFSVACLLIFPILLNLWLRHYGNLNGYSPLVLCVRYINPFVAVNICLYWALLTLSPEKLDSLPDWQHVLFPRLAYFGFLITLIIIIWDPLTIYVVYQKEDPRSVILPGGNVVPKVYNHIKLNWERLLSQNKDIPRDHGPPIVYGLGTALSSVVLVLLQIITLILAMILRDGIVGGVTLCLAAALILLEIFSTNQILSKDFKTDVPLYMVIAWSSLLDVMFYATGHQAALPTIQWESAFVGFHGDHGNTIIPAILILCNTFAAHIIISAALPLILFWPLFRGRSIFAFQKNVKLQETEKGEFSLVAEDGVLQRSLFKVSIAFIACRGARMLGTMCAAGLHRRHLMVWKIFAPKFIFEGIGFLISTIVVILMYMFILRVNRAVIKWTEKLEKSQ